jgi:hypothetical protein
MDTILHNVRGRRGEAVRQAKNDAVRRVAGRSRRYQEQNQLPEFRAQTWTLTRPFLAFCGNFLSKQS